MYQHFCCLIELLSELAKSKSHDSVQDAGTTFTWPNIYLQVMWNNKKKKKRWIGKVKRTCRSGQTEQRQQESSLKFFGSCPNFRFDGFCVGVMSAVGCNAKGEQSGRWIGSGLPPLPTCLPVPLCPQSSIFVSRHRESHYASWDTTGTVENQDSLHFVGFKGT